MVATDRRYRLGRRGTGRTAGHLAEHRRVVRGQVAGHQALLSAKISPVARRFCSARTRTLLASQLVGAGSRQTASMFLQPGLVATMTGEARAAAVRRWQRRLADEQAEAELYRSLAGRRDGEDRAILLAIADAEGRHAAHWQELLGQDVGRSRRGRLRTRALIALARRFGSVFVLALVQQAESRTTYGDDVDATATMAADERIHEEVVRGLAARGRARVSGTFRAAVFGANDGLLSNLSLVLGVSGGGVTTSTILLTGLAGLLAGALSMGAGEWISVRSQRELLTASAPSSGTQALVPHLDVDANELALVYRARGMAAEEAERRATAVLASQEPAQEVSSSEALDAVGSDFAAALSRSPMTVLKSFLPCSCRRWRSR